MKKCYKIAGLTVAMESFGRTVDQAEAYRIDACETVDIEIVSSWPRKKKDYPMLSDDDGEYLATGANFYKQLLSFDGFQLHASAVVVEGRSYLFSAKSGTGKSTHTKLWMEEFDTKAYILNDDKPALRLIDGTWYAFGTPWSGKHDISVNTGVPVAGIAMLERGSVNEIRAYTGSEAVFELFFQTNKPIEKEYRIKLLDLLDKLMTQVPVWKLKCNMEPEAAIVAYEAMSGKKWRK